MILNEIMANGSAAVDRTSVPLQIDDLTLFSVQVVFSGGAGDLAGDLELECTDDADPATATWVTIQGSGQTVVSSTNHFWNVEDAAYRYVRATWVYTSGSGNIKMTSIIKEPAKANPR